MSLVLDTSILIELERRNGKIINKIKELISRYPMPAQITFISYYEFYHGLNKASVKNKYEALSFVNKFNMLRITKKTAEILSDLRQTYEDRGKMLPLADLLIASQVIENKLVLVTLDKDFDRIKELNKVIL